MTADAGRESRLVAGRYALGAMLGRGGMGVVWLAEDRVLERQVALKEVTFPLDVTPEERQTLVERTLREARAAARLDHPRVVRVHDVIQEEGKPWLVMEHVPSRSLLEIVEVDGPLPPLTVARIGLDVLAALEVAHAAGIVHRDVKPANVLVGKDGRARLTDFGIATTTGDSGLTTQGALIGSPTYMAPERAHGEPPRPPVDLWGLGATLYAAVEGRPPFDREDPMATLFAVVSQPPAPMLRAGPLEPALRALLEKDPAQRSTVAQARAQLEAVASGAATTPPPPPPSAESRPALHDSPVQRFDSSDLRKLASASKKVLGAVARETARELTDRRRERMDRPPTAPPRRRRFKKRWVVVPVVVTVSVVILVLIGLGFALAAWLGLL